MDIAPFVGITGTPAIGLSSPAPYLYVVAATQTGGVNPTYNHWLYALSLTTGHPEILPSGVKIATPDSVFNSSQENQRPALLLDNGTVYIGFGSNGLPGDYRGWLLAYNAATLAQTGAFNVTPGHLRKAAFGKAVEGRRRILTTMYTSSPEMGRSTQAAAYPAMATAPCGSIRRADFPSPIIFPLATTRPWAAWISGPAPRCWSIPRAPRRSRTCCWARRKTVPCTS